MDFVKLFQLSYIFDLNPGPFHALGTLIFGLGMVLLVCGFSSRVLRVFMMPGGVARLFFATISNLLLTTGILVLVLWFFRNQQIPLFSARFWWWLVVAMALIWVVFIGNKIKDKIPRSRELQEKKEFYYKYLPRKKGG